MKIFEFVRKTKLTRFLIVWITSLFLFGVIYWLLPSAGQLSVGPIILDFTFIGLFQGIYASFIIATLLGLGSIGHSGIYTPLVYMQAALSGALLLISAKKIVQKYMHMHGHGQDKKINTMMLMMSVTRNDMYRMTHDHRINKKHIRIKDVESVIDGLYVVFLDMERIFSSKNIHKHKLRNAQYLMLTENVEDSLHKLHTFLLYAEKHNIRWKDKSIEFWMHYILDTTEKIAANLDGSGIKNSRILIAIANIRDNSEKIRKLL